MKVSKRTANLMMIAGAVLGVVLVFAVQSVYPRIAEHFGNPAWLANALTLITIGSGILAAIYLLRKKKSN